MSEHVQRLLAALLRHYGFEVAEHTISPNQLRLLGRVQPTNEERWKTGAGHLLKVSGKEGTPWSLDISRQYFIRGGTMVYAWRVIFQGDAIEQQAQGIMSAVVNSPRAHVEVEEQVLSVRGPRSTMSVKGKGASSIGAAPLLIQKRGG